MYKIILVPVDIDQESSWASAFPVAIEYNKAFGAELHALTVLPDFGTGLVGGYFPPGFMEKAQTETVQRLGKLIDDQVPADIKVACHVAQGTIYQEILDTVHEIGADLVIMASHRPALKDYLLGPNAAQVVRHVDVSVLVVRD